MYFTFTCIVINFISKLSYWSESKWTKYLEQCDYFIYLKLVVNVTY